MKRILMFLIILSSIAVSADTGSLDYNGFKIGESKTKIRKLVESRYPWYQVDYKQYNQYSGCNDIIVWTGLGETERKMTFQFDENEKLYLIILTIKNPEDKEVEAIMNGVKQKYGNPASNNYSGVFLWDIGNNKYSISFTVTPLLINSQVQKYSFFEMRYWDVKVCSDAFDHDI